MDWIQGIEVKRRSQKLLMISSFWVCSAGLMVPLFAKTRKTRAEEKLGEGGIKSSVSAI